MNELYFLIQKLMRLTPPYDKLKNKRVVDVVVENMYRKQYFIYNHSDATFRIEYLSQQKKLKN